MDTLVIPLFSTEVSLYIYHCKTGVLLPQKKKFTKYSIKFMQHLSS